MGCGASRLKEEIAMLRAILDGTFLQDVWTVVPEDFAQSYQTHKVLRENNAVEK